MIHPLVFDINHVRNQTTNYLVVLAVAVVTAAGMIFGLALSGHGGTDKYVSVAGTASAVTFILAMLIRISHNSAVGLQRINELPEESRSLVSLTLTAVAVSLVVTGLCITTTALLVFLR